MTPSRSTVSLSGEYHDPRPVAIARRAGSRPFAAICAVTCVLTATALVPTVADAATTRRPVLFRLYSSCDRLLTVLKTTARPFVGPYGLGGYYGTPVIPRPRPGVSVQPIPVGATPRTTKKTTARSTQTIDTQAAAPEIVVAAPASAETRAPSTAAPAVEPAPAVAVEAAPDFGGGSAAAANSSSTNVQEIGVDEGDSVENDGRYLFAVVNGAVRIIDTTNGTRVANLGSANGSEQLLLDKNRLAIVRTDFNNSGPESIVDLWDVTTRSAPRKLSETHLEGSAVSVRSVNGRARIVLNTSFGSRLRFFQPGDGSESGVIAAYRSNLNVLNRSRIDDWLPRSYVVRADGSQTPIVRALPCGDVGKPETPSGLGFTWVATLDLDSPDAVEGARGSAGVIASGNVVYASQQNLFIATSRFTGIPQPLLSNRPIQIQRQPPAPSTDIHMFDLSSRDGARYVASGTTPGRLLNQFSLSEFGGNLRVALTFDRSGFGTASDNGVVVLRRNGSELAPIGRITGLGRTEQIYAVRFVGDLGYIVTFRRTDPLYVLDLRDPTRPKLLGELKIPGYSAYLHPIGPGRLIGVGQDATAEGRVTGTQLSLFDVADPTNPRQLSTLKIGGSSPAEYDHRAFLWWGASKDAVIPFTNFDQGVVVSGVTVARLDGDTLRERGVVRNRLFVSSGGVVPQPVPLPAGGPVIVAPPGVPATTVVPPGGSRAVAPRPPVIQQTDDAIQRSLIVNGSLVTVGFASVQLSDLETLGSRWFLEPDRGA
jgi:hypothetical protein